MNIAEIEGAGKEILALLRDYSHDPRERRELRIDPVVYGFFQGRFENMSRQHYVRLHGRAHPQRIDFRFGGNNPTVIEFAARPPNGQQELYGSQNRSELRKLTRVVPSRARSRVLLLLDMVDHPIQLQNLKPTYDAQNSGPGHFDRHSVRVIYVHRRLSYNFLWRP